MRSASSAVEELQNQDQVRLIDLRDTSRERAGVDHELHALPRPLDGRIGHRFAQTEVVDDNVQEVDAIACRKYLLGGLSRNSGAADGSGTCGAL
jgi:hypothetical protein